jgi:hypothetical protein
MSDPTKNLNILTRQINEQWELVTDLKSLCMVLEHQMWCKSTTQCMTHSEHWEKNLWRAQNLDWNQLSATYQREEQKLFRLEETKNQLVHELYSYLAS